MVTTAEEINSFKIQQAKESGIKIIQESELKQILKSFEGKIARKPSTGI